MIRRALIRSRHQPELFLHFRHPVEECAGSDFRVLEERIRAGTVAGRSDGPVPPGAWVGFVTYEGGFRFSRFPEPEVVDAADLLPDPLHPAVAAADESGWEAVPDRCTYTDMVRRAQEFIRAGDIYQVNLCRHYRRRLDLHDPIELFRGLWQITDAPLASYIEADDQVILSASPELFLSIEGRRILTAPIKGTRPRHPDPLRDRQLAFELSTHEKEIAELVMITDLERNDLGAICEFGSVEVPHLVCCRTYSHVHHLYSEVEGTLREGVHPVEALRACLPGGSISGAPKRRAMEIIADLERRPRGIYTGVIGYFGMEGSAQFSIAIRTAVHERGSGMLSFGAGSGITAGSDAEREFEETRHKARCLVQATQAFLGRVEPAFKG